MLRSPAFRRPMARLALLAILLLALLPTLGRIAQARASGAGAEAPSWGALCTTQGLRSLTPPASPAPPPASGDCAYCPLLSTTITASVAALCVQPLALPGALCTSSAPVERTPPHACGLGSRGPPVAS